MVHTLKCTLKSFNLSGNEVLKEIEALKASKTIHELPETLTNAETFGKKIQL